MLTVGAQSSSPNDTVESNVRPAFLAEILASESAY